MGPHFTTVSTFAIALTIVGVQKLPIAGGAPSVVVLHAARRSLDDLLELMPREGKVYEKSFRIQKSRPSLKLRKRSSTVNVNASKNSQEEIYICPTEEGWINITSATTMPPDEEEVEIYHLPGGARQWFWVVKCQDEYEDLQCRLVSPEHYTRCETRATYVPAYVKSFDNPDEGPSWRIIQVPGQCVCVEYSSSSNGHSNDSDDESFQRAKFTAVKQYYYA